MNELKRILRQLIETQTSDSEYFDPNKGLCGVLGKLHLSSLITSSEYNLCNDLLKSYLDGSWLDVISCDYNLSREEYYLIISMDSTDNVRLYHCIEEKYSLKHAQGKLRQRICIEMLVMLEELES